MTEPHPGNSPAQPTSQPSAQPSAQFREFTQSRAFSERRDWRDVARLGKNGWWRYLVGILFFAFSVFVIGHVAVLFATVFILIAQGIPTADWPAAAESLLAGPSVLSFVVRNLVFLCGLAALGSIVPVLHQRSFWTLLGARQRLRICRLLSAFGFHFGVLSLVGAVTYALTPQDFIFTFQPRLWLGLLLVTIPLTFLQVSCEELFFRGYLLQGFGLLIRSRWLLTILTALAFAAVHFMNPEMRRGWGVMGLYYFSYGVLTSWLTLKDNGLELALGFHLATNFFGILIISAVDSVLPVPSLFTVKADGNPMWTVLVFWLESALFYYVLLGRKARSVEIVKNQIL